MAKEICLIYVKNKVMIDTKYDSVRRNYKFQDYIRKVQYGSEII